MTEAECNNLKVRIMRLEKALNVFANIALAQDDDKRAPDMISGPDLSITPSDVRLARRLLEIERS